MRTAWMATVAAGGVIAAYVHKGMFTALLAGAVTVILIPLDEWRKRYWPRKPTDKVDN